MSICFQQRGNLWKCTRTEEAWPGRDGADERPIQNFNQSAFRAYHINIGISTGKLPKKVGSSYRLPLLCPETVCHHHTLKATGSFSFNALSEATEAYEDCACKTSMVVFGMHDVCSSEAHCSMQWHWVMCQQYVHSWLHVLMWKIEGGRSL